MKDPTETARAMLGWATLLAAVAAAVLAIDLHTKRRLLASAYRLQVTIAGANRRFDESAGSWGGPGERAAPGGGGGGDDVHIPGRGGVVDDPAGPPPAVGDAGAGRRPGGGSRRRVAGGEGGDAP